MYYNIIIMLNILFINIKKKIYINIYWIVKDEVTFLFDDAFARYPRFMGMIRWRTALEFMGFFAISSNRFYNKSHSIFLSNRIQVQRSAKRIFMVDIEILTCRPICPGCTCIRMCTYMYIYAYIDARKRRNCVTGEYLVTETLRYAFAIRRTSSTSQQYYPPLALGGELAWRKREESFPRAPTWK